MSRKQKDYTYHYTYRITNIVEKKYYYGVHSCNCLPKEDIGVKYFSSSKNKAFKDDIKEKPQNYKYKVVKIFNTKVEALEHEIFLHNKFNVGKNPKFYNGAKQTSTGFDRTGVAGKKPSPEHIEIIRKTHTGKKLTDKQKEAIGNANRGRVASDETRKKLSVSCKGENNGMFGKCHSNNTKQKMSEIAKNRPAFSMITRQLMSESSKGILHSEKSKQKMSEIAKNREKVTCSYCNKSGDIGNMTRWHFDKCKFKN